MDDSRPVLRRAGSGEAGGTAQPVTAKIQIAYIGLPTAPPQPSTVLDKLPADEGLLGARLGLADDQTTGTSLKQSFAMAEDEDGAAEL